jgi:hypothetical protein
MPAIHPSTFAVVRTARSVALLGGWRLSMSQLPHLYHSDDPYSVAIPERISKVMVVSVCAMMLGTVGLIMLPFDAIAAWSMYFHYRGGTYGTYSALETWGVLAPTIGTGLALVALVGGAGAMRFNPWARLTLMGYGIGSVLKGLVGIYFHLQIIQLVIGRQSMPYFVYRVTAIVVWIDWVLAALLGAYALYVMTRPEVKAAFVRGRATE